MASLSVHCLRASCIVLLLSFPAAWVAGCQVGGTDSRTEGQPPFMSKAATVPPQASDDAPSPDKTDGFDGKRAFALVAKQVEFGPRPSGTPALARLQDFLQSELKSYGCTVETDSFTADTPIGRLPMKNILVKIPGEKSGIILLGTHYDTLLKQNFVGADDGGSSTALMLELARLLCPQRGRYAVWIAFFDGEEAMRQWSDTDSRYGSREMAAKLAMSGDIKKIRAFLLADIVGGGTARFPRESSSTPALVNLFWNTAHRLGYSSLFPDETFSAEDDHDSFLKRGVPAVDVIGDFTKNGYWHTVQDDLGKISPRTLAIVGHVFLESLKQLQSQ
jgi:glutaminyl-peptide cyclotransferase